MGRAEQLRMNILRGLSGLRQLPPGAVLSVGNFDGVHRGHAQILARARELRAGSPGGGGGVAIATFEPHPLSVLRPELAPPRLMPRAVKHELLAAEGVDHLVELAPAPEILELSAEAFWALLRDELRIAHLIEGPTFTFGKGRHGTIGRLREWATGSGIGVHAAPAHEVVLADLSVVTVSSTLVRWLVGHGRARDAAVCLGRPYALAGEVVKGFQRGRTIGVPTANLNVTEQMVPMDGVYVARCAVDGTTYPAALSVGLLPTMEAGRRQVEAHLLGFNGDLYGRQLSVDVIDWLRDQRKFQGLDPLKAQIARDLDAARAVASGV